MCAETFKRLDVFPHGGFSFVLYLFMCWATNGKKKKSVYVNAVLFCRAHTDFKTLPFQYNIFDLYVFKKKKGYNLLL